MTKVIHNAQSKIAAEISVRGKLVYAVSIALDSVPDVRAFQQAIDSALKDNGLRAVLVDARRAQLSTAEQNESMWSWVRNSALFDRLAIVNESPVLSIAAGMKARAIGTKKVKAFQDHQAAVRWLMERVVDE